MDYLFIEVIVISAALAGSLLKAIQLVISEIAEDIKV